MLTYLDYPINWGYNFQDAGSNELLALIELHDTIIFYLVILLFVVLWFLVSALSNRNHLPNLAHGNRIELVWTITPTLILWAIGMPS